MKKNNKKGFTIVELVIVIAVIAILAAVLIPTFSGVVNKANQNAAMQEARNEYELYLAENAQTLTGDENYLIKSGGYYFQVENGQFKTTALEAKPDGYSENDITKYDVYTKDETATYSDSHYIVDDTGYKTADGVTTGDTYTKETKDYGSANVAIYKKN